MTFPRIVILDELARILETSSSIASGETCSLKISPRSGCVAYHVTFPATLQIWYPFLVWTTSLLSKDSLHSPLAHLCNFAPFNSTPSCTLSEQASTYNTNSNQMSSLSYQVHHHDYIIHSRSEYTTDSSKTPLGSAIIIFYVKKWRHLPALMVVIEY